MSNDLPLKIRADIRDQWDSPKADIQAPIEALTKTLGHKILPQVQWPLLYNSVKGQFEEKSTFVPTISRIAIAFYDRLLSRLDNEAHTDWTEQLLSELAKKPASAAWNLQIEAGDTSLRRPRISWKGAVGAFYLEIPNHKPLMQAEVHRTFDADLDNLFSPTTSTVLNDDEWAEVVQVETRTPTKQQPAAAPQFTVAVPEKLKVDKLPAIHALNRPADLFKSTAPCVLIIDASTSPLTIQGSHQPSLELLAEYLKKWAKANASDAQKRPVLKVELVESPFCFGVIDSISIDWSMNFSREKIPINPALLLAFIEGVLGYKETHTTGYRWIFKLDSLLN